MNKTTFDMMIAALKDKCKQSMEEQGETQFAQPCRWSHHHARFDGRTVDHDQMASISALVSYVSHTTGVSEYRVERCFSNHFCIPNPKCLPSDLYDDAIRYMVDLVPQHYC